MIKVVWLDAHGDEVTTVIHNPDWSLTGFYDSFFHICYARGQKFIVNTTRVVTISIDRGM
jgi:hypothetical protein